jgi:hypothetical protein
MPPSLKYKWKCDNLFYFLEIRQYFSKIRGNMWESIYSIFIFPIYEKFLQKKKKKKHSWSIAMYRRCEW